LQNLGEGFDGDAGLALGARAHDFQFVGREHLRKKSVCVRVWALQKN